MSLRSRFVFASSVVTLATLSASFCAVWTVYNDAQERQLDTVLLAEATEDAVDASYAPDPPAGGRPALRRSELGPIPKLAAIYDAGGHPVAWTPNLEPAPPRMQVIQHATGAPFDLWWNNKHLRAVLSPIPPRGGRLFWLATPRTDLDENAAYLARRMAAAVLIAVAVSALVTWWLTRVLTRDHEHIAAVARAVAAGDLSARIGIQSRDREIAQLGRDIDEMISRLAVLVETQQTFIANASHELRSPITTLLGELSLALRRDRDAATYRESIQEALHSARRLKALTEDLLALARLGEAEVQAEAVSLSEITAEALESLRAQAETLSVTLEASCEGAVVQGRPADLQRLVRNLVENAIRHSPKGGRVRVEACGDAHIVHLAVTDEGPGVPREARERIFEPFFRLPSDRADHHGSGLGLAIARTIARTHGGELWVDDAGLDAHGARFAARIPAMQPTAAIPSG